MTRPQTVIKEKYELETFEFETCLGERTMGFEIFGSLPDRTYEDRDVYFAMGIESVNIKAEDAIKLGQALISHGTRALMGNMVQHQHIHHINALKRFITKGHVEKIIMTQLDNEVPNFGPGHKLFSIKPIWKDVAPEFQEDFEFETVYSPSPFEEEFKEQLAYWEVPVELVGYDREQDLADFQKMVEEIEQEQALNFAADMESEDQHLEETMFVGEETKDESGN
jgi:hypothetical protein